MRRTLLALVCLIVLGLPVLTAAQETCEPNGDVDRSGEVTVVDALLVFLHTIGVFELDACQQKIVDVSPDDYDIAMADVTCILDSAGGNPSCLVPPELHFDYGIGTYWAYRVTWPSGNVTT